jgi:hypothetical protein
VAVQQKLSEENLSQQDLGQTLWKAADILRGPVRPKTSYPLLETRKKPNPSTSYGYIFPYHVGM